MRNRPIRLSNMMGGVCSKRGRDGKIHTKLIPENIKIREHLRRTTPKQKYNIKMYFKDAECEEVD